MSLRHLYKDLRDIGVYPDLVKGDRELVILNEDVPWIGYNIREMSSSKFYGMKFTLRLSTSEYGHMVKIYDHNMNVIATASLSSILIR